MTLSNDQLKELLQPIDPARVKKDENGYSHLAIHDVRARLNQIFGIGRWSEDIMSMELVTERQMKTKAGKDAWYVVYRALSRVTIHATNAVYAEWAAGDSIHPRLGDAHDNAMKKAESQATKRACVNLGDQFGLSLYDGGSTDAIVGDMEGVEFADADNVDSWLAAMKIVATQQELADIVGSIKGSDISAADRNTLLQAYAAAEKRVTSA
jgi:recombination DNA repair RAD52 pathway protein